MNVAFSVKSWAAYAPSLATRDDWLIWAKEPVLPQGDDVAPLTQVAPNVRRRIDPHGRSTLQAALGLTDVPADCPVVFGSQHGETPRAYGLLTTLASGDAISPTSFGLSVHNAIGAQYSMIRHNPSQLSAVSAGRFTAEAAVLEAALFLAEGAPAVVMVVHDAPLPPDYAKFVSDPQCEFAWAWLLTPPLGSAICLELSTAASPVDRSSMLPHALEVFQFFLSDQDELIAPNGQSFWRWSRPK